MMLESRVQPLRRGDVRVVVVAYYGAEELRGCLAGLGGAFPVTVVDNSSDWQVREVATAAGAAYLDPGANRGFAAGVNLALRAMAHDQPQDVLLLNPDAVIAAEDVRELSAVMHAPGNARLGAVSPALRSPDGQEQRVLWPFPAPWRAWLEACGLGRLNRAAGFAVGAVLLLRWEAVREVGEFDERFFLYAEEVDWQRRARARGWRAGLAPAAVAQHVGGGTSTDPARREALFHAGGETYVRKWFGRRGWAAYRAAVLVGALPRWLLAGGERRASMARRARIYRQGPRRAAGLEGV